MQPIEYHHTSEEEIEKLASAFCDQHGDEANGTIPDEEYDKLFDHLAATLRKHATFTEGSRDAEAAFSGYRYVDQIPWITIVPRKAASPAVALAAALEAVSTAHRPLAVSFDFASGTLLVVPPNRVCTTFAAAVLAPIVESHSQPSHS
jgi:hypothetical protein